MVMSEEIRQKSTPAGRLMILATAFLWSLAGVCVKSVTWGTMSIVATRSVISLIILLISKRSVRLHISKINLFAALCTSATGLLYIEAIKLTTAGTAIVLQYVAPILVLLYSILFQHHQATKVEILLTAAAFAGCALSFADSLDFTRLTGNILALLSGFTFAGQIILMNRQDCDTQDCTVLSNTISLLVSLPFFFTDPNRVMNTQNILWVLVLGVFQYGMANLVFSQGIGRTDKIEASLLLMLEPILNPVWVALVNGEMMGPLAIAGSVIVIAAVTFYSLLPHLTHRKEQKA